MQIRARMSMSADGYVTTPSGWPALTADPAFVPGQSHGIQEFLEDCEAALMGAEVDAIDISPAMLALAEIQAKDRKVAVRTQSAGLLSFADSMSQEPRQAPAVLKLIGVS